MLGGLLRKLILQPQMHRKEDATATLLARHQGLVETLAASLLIRSPDGTLTYCSPYTEVLTGYPLAEIYNSTEPFLERIAHPDEKSHLSRANELAKLGESFQMRFRFYHRTGIEMWAEARTTPFRDEDGTFVASITLLMDVTRAVRQEEQLNERTEDLQGVASIAAEEIQNEVFTLNGMLEVAREGESQEIAFSSIARTAEKLNLLARGLTEFGKSTRSVIETRPILLSEIFEMVEMEAQVLHLTAKIPVGSELTSLAIVGEPEEIRSALGSILDYVAGLGGKSKSVQIEVEVSSATDTSVTLQLTDDAPLIPPHLAQNVFRPYRSIEPNQARSGPSAIFRHSTRTPFSLSLARKRIQRLGGMVDYSPTVVDGITKNSFSITMKRSINRFRQSNTL
ncbi:MAG: PAS domain-containing protein [Bdellovibrionales bacterium]|nr:PAS domain-containing protein [Bdellovibrionales bacterium]